MGLKVRDIMQKRPITVERKKNLEYIKKEMIINKKKYVVVISEGKYLGLIKASDLVNEYNKNLSAEEFIELVEEKVEPVTSDKTIKEAAEKIIECNIEFLPIVNKNQELIGIVTPGDIVKDFVVTESDDKMSAERAVIFLAMTQTNEDERYWFDRIKKMGYKAAVTQVGANGLELPLKLREGAIVASIAKEVIYENLREKNAVSNAARDVYSQIEIINRGLGGGFKIAIIRGRDMITVAAYGKCGHALGSGPDHIFMGYSII